MLLGELPAVGHRDADVAELLPAVDGRWSGSTGTATATATVSSSTSAPPTGPGQPGLEGLLRRRDLRRRHGSPSAPIALCEVQGYAYAAYRPRRAGRGARRHGRRAASWPSRRGRLRDRVQRAVLAARARLVRARAGRRQAPGRRLASTWATACGPASSTTSTPPRVAERLLSPRHVQRLRACAPSPPTMGAYNPMSYHNGSVWPHDNAIVVGRADALRLRRATPSGSTTALLDAAAAFGGRLPELFCGFDREEFAPPVPYPTPARRRRGRPPRRCCWSAPCWGSTRTCPAAPSGWPRACRRAGAG